MVSQRGTRSLFLILTFALVTSVFSYTPQQVIASHSANGPYFNVGINNGDIDYKFTHVTYNNDPQSPGLHFGWVRAFGGGILFVDRVFDGYKVQYMLKSSQNPEVTKEKCADLNAAGWADLSEKFNDPFGTAGKVQKRIDDGRTLYSGEAFFRVIGYYGYDNTTNSQRPMPITCSTDPVRSLKDLPTDDSVQFHFKAVDSTSKKELAATVFMNGKPLRDDSLNTATKATTPTIAKVQKADDTRVKFDFTLEGYKPAQKEYTPNASSTNELVTMVSVGADGESTVEGAPDDTAPPGGASIAESGGSECNEYLGISITSLGKFRPLEYFGCQVQNLLNTIIALVVKVSENVPL